MTVRPRARIHLTNIVTNWRMMCASQGDRPVAAVIKADAYGHGLVPVAAALHKAGCMRFFVAYAFEGTQARQAVGPGPVVHVLNGPEPDEEAIYRAGDLTPVINSLQQFQTLKTWIGNNGSLHSGYALHVDTGMNRLGMPHDEVMQLTRIAGPDSGMAPGLILSHLACADDVNSPVNALQLERFVHIRRHFPDVPASLSNSNGMHLGAAFRADMVRVGLALYGGGEPLPGVEPRPGMTLEAPVVQVRMLQPGETVGYGATYKVRHPVQAATIAIGYGDGLPRAISGRGVCVLGGKRCPVIGRISMDLTTIDASAAGPLVKPGVFVQVIGSDVPFEEQARLAGTIGYELITGLTPRVRRIHDEVGNNA